MKKLTVGGTTRCDKRREGGKHARAEKKKKRGTFCSLISLTRVISPRCVLSRTTCSVVSAFSDRHAYSRCTEDRRCFEFQITAHCKFNIKHDIKHREDYHRRQSWTPGVETLDFTICICSTPTFLYFDLYLNTAYAAKRFLTTMFIS